MTVKSQTQRAEEAGGAKEAGEVVGQYLEASIYHSMIPLRPSTDVDVDDIAN